MALYEEIISVQGRKYKIEINEFFLDKTLCWTAYRKINGYWKKIPGFTRTEERRFPKTVGYTANRILKAYQATKP